MDETTLDGNAAGGVLHAIFPFEMTLAESTCANCGDVNTLATLDVYQHGMGTVMRCPSCHTMQLRVAEIQGRYILDMQGVRVLQIITFKETH